MVAAAITAVAALVGALLAYLGARHGSRPASQAVTQSERDEWGRRFSTALELLGDRSARRRSLGRALLDELLQSDLAQDDDRRIAQAVLRAAALASVDPARSALAPRSVDDLAVVEDDGPDSGRKGSDDAGTARDT